MSVQSASYIDVCRLCNNVNLVGLTCSIPYSCKVSVMLGRRDSTTFKYKPSTVCKVFVDTN